jgi:hypothetical protein
LYFFETDRENFGESECFFSSTVIDQDSIWFIGGGSTPLGSQANDILVATLDSPWRLLQPEGHFDRRGHHEAVVHNGKVYLMGGKREDAIEKMAHRDIWVLDLDY